MENVGLDDHHQKSQEGFATTSKLEDIVDEFLVPVEDTLCCLKPCQRRKGRWQKLAHPVTYLILSSVISLIQGLFFTYSNATLSTIEKDFGLPSKLSGFTTTGNDVLLLVLAIPLPFYASRGHRPRWLAFGMLLSVMGCLLAASPHFIFSSRPSPNIYSNESTENSSSTFSCSSNVNNSMQMRKCSSLEDSFSALPKIVVAIFLAAQMMCGVASLLYYTIGQSYLDESVDKATVPLFLAIAGAMRLLGPVCGYSLASATLSLWKDPFRAPPPNIHQSHPRWIGAWWIGYLIIGSMLFAMTWALFLLPKTLPVTRMRTRKELLVAASMGKENFERHVKSLRNSKILKWSDLTLSLYRLFSNPVYRLVVFKQVLQWFAFFGYITFKSKYIEHQFRLSASEANRSIAVISLLAAITGWLGTGASLSYFKPRPKIVVFYMALLSFISCICHLSQMSISCDLQPIKGFSEIVNLKSPANTLTRESCVQEDCKCNDHQFDPVCFNNSTYLNGCYAECSQRNLTSGRSRVDGDVKDGFCFSFCSSFQIYVAISVISKMASTASRVPANILFLRSPEERDKDLGLGLFNALYALGASIPAPIIIGMAIDGICILWGSSCISSRLCWLYDRDYFRYIVHGIPAVVMAVCILLDLCLLRHERLMNLYSKSFNNKTSRLRTNDDNEVTRL